MSDLSKQMERMKLHRHRTTPCMFQRGKTLHNTDESKQYTDKLKSDNDQHGSHMDKGEHTDGDKHQTQEKKSESKFPKLVSQLRTKVHSNTFIVRTKAAVARRKRLERPWMKGNEMRPFYHLWEQEQSTPKGKKLRRVSSWPRDSLRMQEKALKPLDAGIMRECCSTIRSRLPSFPFD